MSKQEVILCEDLESSLKRAIDNCPHDACSFSLTIILTVSAFLNWQAYQS